MEPEFFVKVMGEVTGPYLPIDLKRMAAGGRILPDSLVRKGTGNWIVADNVKGLQFNQPQSSDANESRSRNPLSRTCPFCAEAILAAAKKCKHCGESILPAGEIEPRKTGKGMAGLILLGGLVVSLIGGGIISSQGGFYGNVIEDIPNFIGIAMVISGIAMFFYGSMVFSRREVSVKR